jgi:lipopolysaccharide/colanic/teichoic acid biosynthesis glycosyltransferase
VKRIFDLMAALVSLVVLGPALLVVGALIKLHDGGPVFYRGRRIGMHGRPFCIYKFRTMVVNADKIGGPSTSDDDPRVTGVGRFLRRHKFDELPQLLNVVKGEMSLVGPRPEVEQEVQLYSDAERRLLTVRPGITDYASIRFRNEGEILKGAGDPHEAYRRLIRPEKMRLALRYVEERSLMTDLKILCLTISALAGSQRGSR